MLNFNSTQKPHEQVILQHYLNSPIPETVEPTIEQAEINGFTSLPTIRPFEDNLTAIKFEDNLTSIMEEISVEFEDNLTSNIEENSIESFTLIQEHVSFLSNKKVETSSENKEIDSVLCESLECSPHSSNGEGGLPDPQRESSTSMGGPSDPNQNIFSSMGVYLTHMEIVLRALMRDFTRIAIVLRSNMI